MVQFLCCFTLQCWCFLWVFLFYPFFDSVFGIFLAMPGSFFCFLFNFSIILGLNFCDYFSLSGSFYEFSFHILFYCLRFSLILLHRRLLLCVSVFGVSVLLFTRYSMKCLREFIFFLFPFLIFTVPFLLCPRLLLLCLFKLSNCRSDTVLFSRYGRKFVRLSIFFHSLIYSQFHFFSVLIVFFCVCLDCRIAGQIQCFLVVMAGNFYDFSYTFFCVPDFLLSLTFPLFSPFSFVVFLIPENIYNFPFSFPLFIYFPMWFLACRQFLFWLFRISLNIFGFIQHTRKFLTPFCIILSAFPLLFTLSSVPDENYITQISRFHQMRKKMFITLLFSLFSCVICVLILL